MVWGYLWLCGSKTTLNPISQTSIINGAKYKKKFEYLSSRLAVVFVQSTEVRCWVENEDVVGAAPTGDAPATS